MARESPPHAGGQGRVEWLGLGLGLEPKPQADPNPNPNPSPSPNPNPSPLTLTLNPNQVWGSWDFTAVHAGVAREGLPQEASAGPRGLRRESPSLISPHISLISPSHISTYLHMGIAPPSRRPRRSHRSWRAAASRRGGGLGLGSR